MSEEHISLKDKFGEQAPAEFQHIDEDGTFIVTCPYSGDELVRGIEAIEGEFEIYSYDPVFEGCELAKQLEEQMSAVRDPTEEFPDA